MVNKKMAMVPAIVPSPNINVAISAMISVGNVRSKLSINLLNIAIHLFLVILAAANMAIGKAHKAPTTEPSNDILMVSNNGCHSFAT